MRKRYTVLVEGEVISDDGPKKYTVECDSPEDAMQLAFALDGGWMRDDAAEADASEMLPLAQMYCEILHVEQPNRQER